MPFRVAARTILQLGAELISSDGVAFYELIKNAFDARTKRGVRVSVVIRIPFPQCNSLKSLLEHSSETTASSLLLEQCRVQVLETIDSTAPEAEALKREVRAISSKEQLLHALTEANYMTVRDTGEGMSFKQLETVYLTVGTRSRLEQRARLSSGDQPVLGEKGLGRLSVMRLGMRLCVTTSRAGEANWNRLEIDWNAFAAESNQLVGDLPIAPVLGSVKDDPSESGTTIRISDLNAEWSLEKLTSIGRYEFSRLMDPFEPPKLRIVFRFNGQVVPVEPINKLLFEHADAFINVADSGDVNGAFRRDVNKSERSDAGTCNDA